MKRTKLNYHFHNPNSVEDTVDYLCKLLIEVNAGKVERAMEEITLYAEKCAATKVLNKIRVNKEEKC